METEHVTSLVVQDAAALLLGPFQGIEGHERAFAGRNQPRRAQLPANRLRELVDLRPDRRNCQTRLAGAHRAHVVIGRGGEQGGQVADLPHGAELVEPVERAEGVAPRQPDHSLPVGRVHLPPDLGQLEYRHPGKLLQAAQGIARLDGGMLLDVADQQQPVPVAGGQPAEVAHFPHRNESGLVHQQDPAARGPLQGFAHQQLLEGVRIRRQFLPQDFRRAG